MKQPKSLHGHKLLVGNAVVIASNRDLHKNRELTHPFYAYRTLSVTHLTDSSPHAQDDAFVLLKNPMTITITAAAMSAAYYLGMLSAEWIEIIPIP